MLSMMSNFKKNSQILVVTTIYAVLKKSGFSRAFNCSKLSGTLDLRLQF